MHLTAVVAQFPVTLSIPSNLKVIDSVLEQTNVGDLVIFPEGAASGYSTDTMFLQQINQEELTAGLEHVRNEAERRKINIWVGACVNIEVPGSILRRGSPPVEKHRSIARLI